MSGQFDFREGMLLEKVVYKDTTCDWKSCIMYTGCLIFCYSWGIAWFSLFFWAYIFHEQVTFWVFIGCWLVHIGIIIGFGASNLYKSKQKHIKKKQDKEELERQQEKIDQAKRKKHLVETDQGNDDKKDEINHDEKLLPNFIQTEMATLKP